MCLRLNSIRSLTAMLALLLAGAASAQVNSATLLGTVRDSTGASIPGATITSRNVETAQERVAKSDPGGNYTIPNLQVGRYRLTVAAPGFKTATVTGIELQVA